MPRCYSTLLLSTLAFASPIAAQTNWPSFRGVHADGLANGEVTPLTWHVEASENILWKHAIPGLGHSSPIIWGNRLFVTSAVNQRKAAPLKVGLYGDPASANDNDVQQWNVFSLNKNTGEILWQKTANEGVPKLKRHPKSTHANCTMATDGMNLIAFFGSEGLYCYDMDGHLKWQKDFGVLRTSPMVYNDKPDPEGIDLEWGFASSPIIYDGRVFVQFDVRDLEHAEPMSRWRAAAINREWLETYGRIQFTDRERNLENVRRRGLPGADSGGLARSDFPDKRARPAARDVRGANRCGGRRLLARRRGYESICGLERAPRWFLYADSVSLWGFALQLS